MKLLVFGGAGFVGSSVVRLFKRHDGNAVITVFDNLHRRGSEINLPVFKHLGVRFIHGDVRSPSDLEEISGEFDLCIEASAEPSVHAGVAGSGAPDYVLQTNLVGAANCLNYIRRRVGKLVFLSTSRVYSIEPLRNVAIEETATRMDLAAEQQRPGVSREGFSEDFTTAAPRSLYGTTKLCAELLVQEFADLYGLNAVIYRCGVIAGPGQFGKTDQGVFTFWVASHYFGRPLQYTGFGGQGKQVRDLLHPEDLFDLIRRHMDRIDASARTYNVGGGRQGAVSLMELTELCRQVTGRKVPMSSLPETSRVDIPIYISDCRKIREELGWSPQRGVETIVRGIDEWIRGNEAALAPIFGL